MSKTDREVYGRLCSVCKADANYLATYYAASPRYAGSRSVIPLCEACLRSLVDTTTPPWKFREMDWYMSQRRGIEARRRKEVAARNMPPMLPGTEGL
jgi:hypothetical protein